MKKKLITAATVTLPILLLSAPAHAWWTYGTTWLLVWRGGW